MHNRYCRSCLALVLAFAGVASATQHTPLAPVPPPPGLEDPGVQAAPAPPAKHHAEPPAATPAPNASVGLPPLPALGGGGERDANGDAPPTVSVHERDGNRIEEYRMGAQLIMVRITPRHGVAYTYFVDDHGRLQGPPGAPAVKPVYYTLFEWGKPPAAASSSP